MAALLVPITTPLCAKSHLFAQVQPQVQVFEWVGARVAVIPDSTLGVIMLAHPTYAAPTTFTTTFHPDSVAEWIRLSRTTTFPHLAPPTLRSDGWSRLVWTGQGLAFADSGKTPLHIPMSELAFDDFLVGLTRAAEQSYRDSNDPVTSTDVRGNVFWSYQSDSSYKSPTAQDIPAPRYPPHLRSQGIRGAAWVRYVIDEEGRVEPSTLTTVWATDQAFADAAIVALKRGRFVPGRLGGKPVRAGVLQSVTFNLGGR